MATEILTKDDLVEFKKELLLEIKAMISGSENQNSEWLRSSQVRNMLHISPNTLQQLRVSGKISYSKVGGIFFYNAKELQQMMGEGTNGRG